MAEMSKKTRRATTKTHAAGALDIRNVIGSLLAVYGVILLLMGLLADTADDKTGGVNANLWAGLALLVVGVAFIVWTRAKPIQVPEVTGDSDDTGPPPGH